MVSNILNFGRSGVHDWLIQRVSAVIIASYSIFLLTWLVFNESELTFIQWQGFMSNTWMRIYSLLFVVSVAAHSWIGLWTVATDYFKSNVLRISVLGTLALTLFVYIVWSVGILWRI